MEAKALESKAAATPPPGDAKAGAPSPAASPTALASGAAGFDEADLAAQTQLEHDVEVDFDAEDKRLAYKLGEHAWALDGAAPDVITALKCDSTALYWATAGGVLVAYDPKRRQQTLRLELARHAARTAARRTTRTRATARARRRQGRRQLAPWARRMGRRRRRLRATAAAARASPSPCRALTCRWARWQWAARTAACRCGVCSRATTLSSGRTAPSE
jgi:hypothetical protein